MSDKPQVMDYWVAQQIVAAQAAGERKGIKSERERIIKMLEDLDRHGSTHSEFCAARHAYAAKAIELIKGENK